MATRTKTDAPTPHLPDPHGPGALVHFDDFLAMARTAYGNKARPTLDVADCIVAARGIFSLCSADDRLAALLLTAGVDASLLAAAELFCVSIETHLALLPPDLRSRQRVSPADKALLAEAANYVAGLRRAVRSGALSLGKGEASRLLGTGKPLVKTSASDVAAAIQQFLIGAVDARNVLDRVGIGSVQLEKLRDYKKDLDRVPGNKSQRTAEQDRIVTELEVHQVALERWLQLYRSKVELACIDDAMSRTTALKPLPRRTKAKAAAAEVAPAPTLVDADDDEGKAGAVGE